MDALGINEAILRHSETISIQEVLRSDQLRRQDHLISWEAQGGRDHLIWRLCHRVVSHVAAHATQHEC